MASAALHSITLPAARPTRPTRSARQRRVRVQAVVTQDRPATAQQKNFKNQLEALKAVSKVVADTGEVDSIKQYEPTDATTNPSLVLKAVQMPQYEHFLGEALAQEKGRIEDSNRRYVGVADRLTVNLGAEILKIVPGRVSTEVDAHLSFDTQKSVDKALKIIDQYAKLGYDPERIYIKMASTWEGARACEILQKQGIDCNMTLLFSFAQAAACADAGAALISPFVGRIMDWYKAKTGKTYAPEEDPGVHSVQKIYKYYKKYGYKTIVMAASFRNIGEIRQLAGCDNITISTALLGELEASTEPLPRMLYPTMGGCDLPQYDMGSGAEKLFYEMHNEDQMAVDKLKEGIDGFARDQVKLEDIIAKLAAQA